MGAKTVLVLAALALAISGCKSKQHYDSHGLRSIEIEMNEEDVGGLDDAAQAHMFFPGKARVDGAQQTAAISAAGASTVLSPRKSLNIAFKDGGYRGAHEVRLAAVTGDPTVMRPYLALEMFAAAGVQTSWAEPVFVYLNERVLGVYVMTEEIDDDFFANRGIHWDRFYEAEGDADFGPTFEARIKTAFHGRPKPANLDAMILLRRILTIVDPTEFEARLFAVLDRQSVINYMVGAQIANQWDGFNKNIYYYQDHDSHLISLSPWDFDLTWAVDRGDVVDAWYLNDLFVRIGNIPSVRSAIQAKLTTLLAGPASPANLDSRIAYWKAKIAPAYPYDPWWQQTGKSFDDQVSALKTAVDARLNAISH